MKKFTFFLLGLVALVALLDLLIGGLMKKQLESSSFRFQRLYHQGFSNDPSMVIGNSRAQNSLFVPYIDSLQLPAIAQMSYNAMPAELVELFAKDYIDRYPECNRIFIECSFVLNPGLNFTYLSQFRPYVSSSVRLDSVFNHWDQADRQLAHFFNFYQLNSELTLRAVNYLHQSDEYWINKGVIRQEQIDFFASWPDTALAIQPEALHHLENLLLYCKSQQVDPVLFWAPYLPAYANKMQNLEEVIQQLSDQLQLPVHNYSRLLQQNHLFADRVHLNIKGAKALIRQMNADGLFTSTTSVDSNRLNDQFGER